MKKLILPDGKTGISELPGYRITPRSKLIPDFFEKLKDLPSLG